jgi:hypothetical protein
MFTFSIGALIMWLNAELDSVLIAQDFVATHSNYFPFRAAENSNHFSQSWTIIRDQSKRSILRRLRRCQNVGCNG